MVSVWVRDESEQFLSLLQNIKTDANYEYEFAECFQHMIYSIIIRVIVIISTSLQRSKSVYLNILNKTVLLNVSEEFLRVLFAVLATN